MAESDHQIKYRKDVNERQEDWQRSINKGASGESRAQLLKQIDAAEKLLEAIKTLRGRAIVPLIERTTQLLSSAQVPKPFGLEQTETTNHIFR